LSILAGPHLTETARGITSHLWECFVDAPSSEEIFVVRPPKISDEALVAAIKAELGIKTIELMPSA